MSECIKRSGRIHLKDAARILEVSEMTIRRDLNAETEGPIPMSLLGGYIVSVTQPSSLAQNDPQADIFTPRSNRRATYPQFSGEYGVRRRCDLFR
ncbi:DeoR family transcriptional regulator [Providencia stuartii]|nr:DeoR family transcriptional regulator [Providencia stuartii]